METNDKYCPRCNFYMRNNNCIRCGYIELNNTDNEQLKAPINNNEKKGLIPLILSIINLIMAPSIVLLIGSGIMLFSIFAAFAENGGMLLQSGFIIMVVYIIFTLLFFIISYIKYFKRSKTKKRKYILLGIGILILLYLYLFCHPIINIIINVKR